MCTRHFSFITLATVLSLMGTLKPAAAAVIYDETFDGDLSNDPLAPTPLTFSVGSNEVVGNMFTPDDTRDFITFTIQPDQRLEALRLLRYQDLDLNVPGNRGFHAINLGTTSFIPSGGTADNFLGGSHLDPVPEGTDLLPVLAMAPQAGTGFITPLEPGDYSYVIQQTGPQLTGYTVDFVVSQVSETVPEPFSILGSAVGLGLGALLLKKKHQV